MSESESDRASLFGESDVQSKPQSKGGSIGYHCKKPVGWKIIVLFFHPLYLLLGLDTHGHLEVLSTVVNQNYIIYS